MTKELLIKIDGLKDRIDKHRPIDRHFLGQIKEYFRIGLIYSSNALHRLFYYRIDSKQAGKYRKQKVIITGTDFIPPGPEQIPELMSAFADRIPDHRRKYHPVEFSALLHKELVTIHPFIDGNGRAARLLMNLAFLQDGYPIVIIPPVLKRDYLNALDRTHRGDDKPFLKFIAGVCYESAKEYLRLLDS